jgi:hypothetical protein
VNADVSNDDLHELLDDEGRNACNGMFYYSVLPYYPRMKRNADILVFALSKFISIPSVSSIPDHREHCRQAAIWLTKCLAQLGASSKTVCTLFFFAQLYLEWGI